MPEPWPVLLQEILATQPCVVVTVARIKGSAPRELGARMLVTADACHGSIGGGNLELQAQQTAGRLLEEGSGEIQFNDRFGLGPALNQCCGGAVTLLYEYCQSSRAPWLETAVAGLASGQAQLMLSAIDADVVQKWVFTPEAMEDLPADFAAHWAGNPALPDPTVSSLGVDAEEARYLLERLEPALLDLYLFGAGHVGKAVVQALQPLPFRIHWIDSRPEELTAAPGPRLEVHLTDAPLAVLADSPPEALYLVMTHSHELDEDICHAVLEKENFRWLGLIGSAIKAQRFRHRLANRGIDDAALARLVCPVGLAGVKGKRPATIAVAVAAQLLSDEVPDGWK